MALLSVNPSIAPLAILATGLPGIRRGNKKFNTNAITKVITYHPIFLARYFLNPFKSYHLMILKINVIT